MRLASLRRGLLAASIALVALAAGSSYVLAEGAPPAEGDAIVAKVGVRTITAREVERRLATVPPFQLRYFGKTHDEIRKRFLEEGIVKETLYAEGADAEKMRELTDVGERIRSVLRTALLNQIRAEVAASGPITDDDVRAYYDQHKEKYHAPPRITVWRILVASRDDAVKVIEKAKADLSPKRWNELARDESVDKTTSMRGGNLGFVAPDGSTTDPNLKVDPVLYAAAEKVKDSELVAEPVAEGSSWAVVWRRQSMKAVERPLALEAPSIRQILAHERTDKRVRELVAELRKKYLSDPQPELLDLLEISAQGDVSPVKRPGTLPSSRRPAAGPMKPTETPAGQR
jgi:peptidyl-prolyl cis-trans isomerase C